MSDEFVTLEADLFDTRDPARPPVYVAAKGRRVLKSIADELGGVYSVPGRKARREGMVEDKAVKPAETKKPRRAKKAE